MLSIAPRRKVLVRAPLVRARLQSAPLARGALSALALLALVACESRPTPTREWRPEDHVQPVEADPSRVGAEPTEQPVEVGGIDRAAGALWNVTCATCHGRDGLGQGPGRPPGAQIPDFTSAEFQKSRTDAQLTEVIVHGRNMMPPFGKQVNEQGVQALVAHIRRFGDSQAPAQ